MSAFQGWSQSACQPFFSASAGSWPVAPQTGFWLGDRKTWNQSFPEKAEVEIREYNLDLMCTVMLTSTRFCDLDFNTTYTVDRISGTCLMCTDEQHGSRIQQLPELPMQCHTGRCLDSQRDPEDKGHHQWRCETEREQLKVSVAAVWMWFYLASLVPPEAVACLCWSNGDDRWSVWHAVACWGNQDGPWTKGTPLGCTDGRAVVCGRGGHGRGLTADGRCSWRKKETNHMSTEKQKNIRQANSVYQ